MYVTVCARVFVCVSFHVCVRVFLSARVSLFLCVSPCVALADVALQRNQCSAIVSC